MKSVHITAYKTQLVPDEKIYMPPGFLFNFCKTVRPPLVCSFLFWFIFSSRAPSFAGCSGTVLYSQAFSHSHLEGPHKDEEDSEKWNVPLARWRHAVHCWRTGNFSSPTATRLKWWLFLTQMTAIALGWMALPVSYLAGYAGGCSRAAATEWMSMHPVSSPPAGVHGSNQERLEQSMDLLDRSPWFPSIWLSLSRSVCLHVHKNNSPFNNPPSSVSHPAASLSAGIHSWPDSRATGRAHRHESSALPHAAAAGPWHSAGTLWDLG